MSVAATGAAAAIRPDSRHAMVYETSPPFEMPVA